MDVSELVDIPAGQVRVADPRARRSWSVEIAPFRLGACPVTQGRYAEVTGQRPSEASGDRLPVENVSWWDAVRFCNALSERDGLAPAYQIAAAGHVEWDTAADGYRLPTEAEWEYACRAGTTDERYGPLGTIAWYRTNARHQTHDVGGKRPNPWGLYDMLGNVLEWCWDGDGAERTACGSSWLDEAKWCRASARHHFQPVHFVADYVGFRVARSAVP